MEAQGGEKRAKYGYELIKKWSVKLTEKYGKSYNSRYLRLMRQFYSYYPIWKSVISKLSWTHYIRIVKIKEINKRNYYINQTILNNLSTRELDNLIKSNAYERLSYADKNNIELISKDKELTIEDMIKDPIIINIDNKTYRIDLLFFNIEINSYIVVEIKQREINPKDISQLQFYVNYVDNNNNKILHNKTIGILIVKKIID